jgi:homocysteine S-methyltransferase
VSKFIERLQEQVLLADGAIGSLLHERGVPLQACFEQLNLQQAHLIQAIHLEYVAAGAKVVETNTFGANRFKLSVLGLDDQVAEINRAGARLAKAVVPQDVFVAGAIGPLGAAADEATPDDRRAAYIEQAVALAEGGADVILCETFNDLDDLATAVAAIKSACDLPVIAQLAFAEDLHTATGADPLAAIGLLRAMGADVIGGNCATGPSGLIKLTKRFAELTDKPLSAFPNGGFPQFVDGRYLFRSTPEYLGEAAVRLAEAGANLIGGCCGTGPAHIRAMAQALGQRTPAKRIIVPAVPVSVAPPRAPEAPDFLRDVGNRLIITVEVDPPKDMDMGPGLEGARLVAEAGADAISVGENPLAKVRMSAFVFGHHVQQHTGLPAIVHCTCRDRNLIGQQSELMGAAILGVRSVFCVTGDPAGPMGQGSVYHTNAFGLIELVSRLNNKQNMAGQALKQSTDFLIGAAMNPNVRRLEIEVQRAEKKIRAGAQFFQTQPVFSPEQIVEVYEATKHFEVPVFIGIMPLYSARNAEYLHNEVPGIRIPDAVRARIAEAPPEAQTRVGVEMAKELIDVALQHAPGIYLIPPFNKYAIAAELVAYARSKAPALALR